MKCENYFVGLDIGTDSVGYAVTNEQYELCKFQGEPMWGVTLFDETASAAERRGFRTARRRLDRRQHRVQLVQELFAKEIDRVDGAFFKRIKESWLYPEQEENKIRLFGTYEEQKAYADRYPTIHHLIVDLMEHAEPHDVRLVYLACAWLVAHRGHFLSEVDKQNIDGVLDFNAVYDRLVCFLTREEYELPWERNIDLLAVQDALKSKSGIQKKTKALAAAVFGMQKVPKEINERYEYQYELVLKLLCGGKVGLKDLFGKEDYENLEEKSVALNMDDEKLAVVMQSIGDDAELISTLKAVYDWSVLVDVLKGCDTVSQAKVATYEQHRNDLIVFKRLVKKYLPKECYDEIFRADTNKHNYAAYVRRTHTKNQDVKLPRTGQEELCKFLLPYVRNFVPEESDSEVYQTILARLECNDFLPKQVDTENRVIPYQLYWYELNQIIEQAKGYLPFLNEADEDGVTGAEKLLSVFEFRVPYYVGPLKENPQNIQKLNHWMVRKAEGKITPWNFDRLVDSDASEEAFIARMTNSCTYLPGEEVLPKRSLLYCAFEVLNEINNIRIDGNEIPVPVKQSLFNDVFMKHSTITPKRIRDHLIANHHMRPDGNITGLDVTVKSSLKPFLQFERLVRSGLLTYADAEAIIRRATYSEDKTRFSKWVKEHYSHLPETEVGYLSSLKFKEFGRLSKKLLCGIPGAINPATGEYMTIIRAMWETNNNLMQLLSDRFDFRKTIDEIVQAYYVDHRQSLSERVEELYVPNAVKRPIIRTLTVLKEVVKVQGHAPDRIFIEMARGTKENLKGQRTDSRLKQLQTLYEKVRGEEVRKLQEQLDAWGISAPNKLQSDKLFLYFLQFGKCLYTGREMDIESVLAGDGTYNIEHIYPRSFVKDDSVWNNKILVDSKVNGEKSDRYPIDPAIQEKMIGYWSYLHKLGAINDEKFQRLTRKTSFTEEEKFQFINRQLVETRQSTKAVAGLLQEFYPDTEIVYVKAGLASEFRQTFGILKSRAVNDLHHAKDAYLNIVVGNVYHSKFSRRFWRAEEEHNPKPEVLFTRSVVCNGQTVWNGPADKDRVLRIVRKNAVHLTKYAFCRKGGFFDQMPVSAAKGLTPLKQGRPTEIYGGYNKSTATFFVLVRYQIAKKRDVMVMPVELLHADRFLHDDAFAVEYAKRTVSEIVNKPVESVAFLLNRRILKINTMLSLNGFRVCITGKSGGGRQLGISCLTAFKTSADMETYVKRLESFDNKKKKNADIIFSETHDGITAEKNLELYDLMIQKLQTAPYQYRPNNPVGTLVSGRETFQTLAPDQQATVLLAALGLFGRAITADLTAIGGVSQAGAGKLSSSISNWKKNYTDVRIIDAAASGLFETGSDVNLLDLL